jgi:CubicO group peptidase (beta-lactamase class C family)
LTAEKSLRWLLQWQRMERSSGMKQTFVKYPPGAKNVAVKYYSDDTPAPHIYFGPLGGAGFYSSALELVKYGMFHLKNPLPDQKRIFRDEAVDKMHEVQHKNIPDAMMGLGWGCVEIDDGVSWVISNGRISGANSNISLIPSENLAVVCLANTSKSITDKMATDLFFFPFLFICVFYFSIAPIAPFFLDK